jgi:hypothetical protein
VAERHIESLKEEIKYETEVLKLATLVALAIGGGSISLLLGGIAPLRIVLAGAGMLVTIGVILTVWRQDRRIRVLVALMKEIV